MAQRYGEVRGLATQLLAGMLANPLLANQAVLESWERQEVLADAALRLACYLDRLAGAEVVREDEDGDALHA
jgi:hypothetical protein